MRRGFVRYMGSTVNLSPEATARCNRGDLRRLPWPAFVVVESNVANEYSPSTYGGTWVVLDQRGLHMRGGRVRGGVPGVVGQERGWSSGVEGTAAAAAAELRT